MRCLLSGVQSLTAHQAGQFTGFVYINTLMLQRVLDETPWSQRMTDVDMRGLTPLVYGHVNPHRRAAIKLGAEAATSTPGALLETRDSARPIAY
jgi:hypothetical protein